MSQEETGPWNAKQILELGRRPRPALVSQPHGKDSKSQEPLNIIPENSYTLLVAESGHGKTWFALDLARLMATETAKREEPLLWLGVYAVEHRKVLYLDEENGGSLIGQRLDRLGLRDNADLTIMSRSHLKLDGDKGVESIIKCCEENRCKVVILDSFVRFHGQDENASQPMARVSEAIRDVVASGLTVIALHHTRKGGGSDVDMLRGSTEITAGADTVLFLKRLEKDKKRLEEDPDKFILSASKLRYASKYEFRSHYIWRKEEGERVSFVYAGDVKASDTNQNSSGATARSLKTGRTKPRVPSYRASCLEQVTRLLKDESARTCVQRNEIRGNNSKMNEAIKELLDEKKLDEVSPKCYRLL